MIEVQRGSKEAFEVLYDRHKTQIYSYIDNMVRSNAWAQELTQDTFLRVFEKKAMYRKEYSFTSWLYSIARNLTLDELKRKDASRFQVTLKDADGEVLSVEDLEATEGDQPFDQAFMSMQRDQIQAAMAQLKDEYQDVINLRIFSEMSYDEIAEQLGIKVSSVKTHLNRAKKELITILKDEMSGDGNEK